MAGTNTTFTQLISQCAEKTPDSIAAIFSGGHKLTYQQLENQANQLAHILSRQGVERGDFVGLMLPRNHYMLTGLLAIAKVGATYVPLDIAYPKRRLSFIVDTVGMRLVLTTSDSQQLLPQHADLMFALDTHSSEFEKSRSIFVDNAAADALAYVMFTSGSTGKPKGVKVTHSAVLNLLTSMQERPGFTQINRLLAVTTVSFDISILELLLPLVSGGTVVVASSVESADGECLKALIDQYNIDTLQATPSTWRLLLAAEFNAGGRFRALCGGEPFPVQLAHQLHDRCAEVWNMYGPTEATIWSTCYRVPKAFTSMRIGTPINNTECYVLDSNMKLVAADEIGELFIGGAGVARGYINREEDEQSRFIQNPFGEGRLYKTGDLVTVDENGELTYIERVDDQLKIRGYRIEVAEIERALERHPDIDQAVVAAKSYSDADFRLIAYLCFAPHAHLTSTETRQYLRELLPDYMVPQLVVEVEEFPLTPNGKIDRQSLPDPLLAEREQGEHHAPRSEFQKLAAAIWEKHLKIDDVGLTDNFFDLGGHSVLAMLVIHDMKIKMGININVVQLASQTLEQLLSGVAGSNALSAVEHQYQGDNNAALKNATQSPIGTLIKKIFKR